MFGEKIRPESPLRVGIVQQQDVSTARVRVVFADLDQMTSYWLPVVVPKSQDDKAYWIPDVGEQVVCLMDAYYEAGAVLGAIYSQVDTTPVASADKFHLGFKDGAAFEYDRSAHVLSLSFSDGTKVTYDAGANALSLTGGANCSVEVNAEAGIKLESGNTSVRLNPNGDGKVHISPAAVTP